MTSPVHKLDRSEKIQPWLDIGKTEDYKYHDSSVFPFLTLQSATLTPTPTNPYAATTIFSLKVSQSLCNPSGTLHGGAVALIYDVCTSMALELCSEDGFWDTGHVSRTLNCTYLRPAREGATLTVESEVVNLGRRMAMLKGVMRGEDGKICSTCEHGKVAVGGAGL